YILYNDTSIYGSKILNAIFWGIPIICAVLIFTIRSIPDKIANYLFSFLFLGILIGVLIAINSLLGLSHTSGSQNQASYQLKEGLIFEPNSSARFKTEEFDYISSINSLGLRNAEINVAKDQNTY